MYHLTCYTLTTASLDRRMGSKTHTVSLTLDVCPTQEHSSHGKPNVYLDLSDQRHETTLPGGYNRAKLVEAVKEGVEGGCLQGKGSPLLLASTRAVSYMLGCGGGDKNSPS